MSLLTLPLGPYININNYLDYLDISKQRLINKHFYNIIKDHNFLRCLIKSKFDVNVPDNVDIYQFFRSLFYFQATFRYYKIPDYWYVDGDIVYYNNLDKDQLSVVIDSFKISIGTSNRSNYNTGELTIKYEGKEYEFDVQEPDDKDDIFDELEEFRERFKLPVNLCIFGGNHPRDEEIDGFKDRYLEDGSLFIDLNNRESGLIIETRRQYTNNLLTIMGSMTHKIDESLSRQYTNTFILIKQAIFSKDHPCLLNRAWNAKFNYFTNTVVFEKEYIELESLRGLDIHLSDNRDEWNIPFTS